MIATFVNFVSEQSEVLLSVPEPMSVLLLGLVLIAVSERLRLRMRHRAATSDAHGMSAEATASKRSLEPVAG